MPFLATPLYTCSSWGPRGWEIVASQLGDEHLPLPSTNLHPPVKLVSGLMSHLVRHSEGYLDQEW